MPWENTGSGTSPSATARPATGARTSVVLTNQTIRVCPQPGLKFTRSGLGFRSASAAVEFGRTEGWPAVSDAAKPQAVQQKSGMRIPGFAQLQRLGKSLMLPIAVLPAAGILLRLGQDDLLGRIKAPVIGPFFQAMSAAGGALFTNLALLFAVGVAIGFARKADGSTALSAVVGYLVMQAVFKTMSPFVLAGQLDKAGEQAQINYSVFGGIVVGLLTAWLFDRYHTIQLPSYLGFFGGRRFVPIVVSLATLVVAFAMS